MMYSYDQAQMPVAHPAGTRGEAARSLRISLQCPRCHVGTPGFECLVCGFRMHCHHGIVHALPPERGAHYQQFVRDYEYIRAAEGRGSCSEAYYLALPYRDVTQKNNAQWKIRARSYDYLAKRLFRSLPDEALILDLGAGNGWLSYRLSLAGHRPVAVDLLTNAEDGLGASRYYEKHVPRMFPCFQAELARLPFKAEQFELAIFNASFHYAEDEEAVLREALRCVRPGGLVVVCDTPWYPTEENGRRMVAERRSAFRAWYATESRSLESLEFVTDERLNFLQQRLGIRWQVYRPWYGVRWALRPWIAKLRGLREPSRFHIYVTRKDA